MTTTFFFIISYSGNTNLHKQSRIKSHMYIIIGSAVGASVLLLATVISCLVIHKGKRRYYEKDHIVSAVPTQRPDSWKSDDPAEAAHCFSLAEIETATNNFEKRIGSGGFGIVYYGKLKEGKEIAVKVLRNNSYQGKREFSNEVTLLSRIHHRNLVQLIGYCREEENSILVYEFMHNGTLKEHLYGTLEHGRSINWIKRLEIAEDAAKGIEYLHTGCVPVVIHRDLKTSNILLDRQMRAKVSDFGLSKLAVDGVSHVSSIVRGTVGYLDPEYYISQQLTDKSDVYSFGVILLELISGQEAISNESFGLHCRNIVQWAKLHIESGDIQGIIDPLLGSNYDLQSMWKIAEKALMCVQPHGDMRPSISEVLKEIQDAISIEKEAETLREGNSDEASRNSFQSSMNIDPPSDSRASASQNAEGIDLGVRSGSLISRLKLDRRRDSDFVPLPGQLLRKYIAYARSYVFPRMSKPAADIIQKFYLKLRDHNVSADGTPITARQLESLVRLAEARARLDLRVEITAQDAMDVVEIMKESLYDKYIDEHGVVDFGRSGGMSQQKEAKRFLNALNKQSELEQKDCFSVSEIYSLADRISLKVPDMDTFIENLNSVGYLLKKGPKTYQVR
ncbi:tyrosine kinase domain protein [Medicago truncatula]|uniref:DNA helicase n=1 Tax=Medicago truncatula TaxID=3880 RepID=G7L4I8_MEDTR|nr:tyrosine kinase domain protein [Medicago truncatula]